MPSMRDPRKSRVPGDSTAPLELSALIIFFNSIDLYSGKTPQVRKNRPRSPPLLQETRIALFILQP